MNSNNEQKTKRQQNMSMTVHQAYQAQKEVGKKLVNYLSRFGYTIQDEVRSNDSRYITDFVIEKIEPFATVRYGVEYKHYSRPLGVNELTQVISRIPDTDFQRFILLSESNFSKAAFEYARSIDPIGIELVDARRLNYWMESLVQSEKAAEDNAVVIFKSFSKTLATEISKNPYMLNNIEWRFMEMLLTEVFESFGFNAELTPGSKDGGKDIILSYVVAGEKKSYIVEIKHWRSGQRVGNQAVKDFVNVIVSEGREKGVYLSTYGYTKKAFESLTEVERKKVNYGSGDEIMTLCRNYTKLKSGLWSPPSDLNEILEI